MLQVIKGGGQALLGLAFGQHICAAIPELCGSVNGQVHNPAVRREGERALGITLIIMLTLVNCAGLRHGSTVQSITSAVKMGLTMSLIASAILVSIRFPACSALRLGLSSTNPWACNTTLPSADPHHNASASSYSGHSNQRTASSLPPPVRTRSLLGSNAAAVVGIWGDFGEGQPEPVVPFPMDIEATSAVIARSSPQFSPLLALGPAVLSAIWAFDGWSGVTFLAEEANPLGHTRIMACRFSAPVYV